MSIKSIKEKELLVNLAKSFGQKVDPNLLSEVEQHKKFENNIRESIITGICEVFTIAVKATTNNDKALGSLAWEEYT